MGLAVVPRLSLAAPEAGRRGRPPPLPPRSALPVVVAPSDGVLLSYGDAGPRERQRRRRSSRCSCSARAITAMPACRARRHDTARLTGDMAVPGPRSRHGGAIRHGTIELPCRIVPCLAMPCLAVPGGPVGQVYHSSLTTCKALTSGRWTVP